MSSGLPMYSAHMCAHVSVAHTHPWLKNQGELEGGGLLVGPVNSPGCLWTTSLGFWAAGVRGYPSGLELALVWAW